MTAGLADASTMPSKKDQSSKGKYLDGNSNPIPKWPNVHNGCRDGSSGRHGGDVEDQQPGRDPVSAERDSRPKVSVTNPANASAFNRFLENPR
jgi:hypothetical protein